MSCLPKVSMPYSITLMIFMWPQWHHKGLIGLRLTQTIQWFWTQPIPDTVKRQIKWRPEDRVGYETRSYLSSFPGLGTRIDHTQNCLGVHEGHGLGVYFNKHFSIQTFTFCVNKKCIKTRKSGGLANKGRPGRNQICIKIFLPNMTYSMINDDSSIGLYYVCMHV